jgi:hypothetical protein
MFYFFLKIFYWRQAGLVWTKPRVRLDRVRGDKNRKEENQTMVESELGWIELKDLDFELNLTTSGPG